MKQICVTLFKCFLMYLYAHQKRPVVMAMATLRDTAHSNNTHKDNSDALNWYSTINKDASE